MLEGIRENPDLNTGDEISPAGWQLVWSQVWAREDGAYLLLALGDMPGDARQVLWPSLGFFSSTQGMIISGLDPSHAVMS